MRIKLRFDDKKIKFVNAIFVFNRLYVFTSLSLKRNHADRYEINIIKILRYVHSVFLVFF